MSLKVKIFIKQSSIKKRFYFCVKKKGSSPEREFLRKTGVWDSGKFSAGVLNKIYYFSTAKEIFELLTADERTIFILSSLLGATHDSEP